MVLNVIEIWCLVSVLPDMKLDRVEKGMAGLLQHQPQAAQTSSGTPPKPPSVTLGSCPGTGSAVELVGT